MSFDPRTITLDDPRVADVLTQLFGVSPVPDARPDAVRPEGLNGALFAFTAPATPTLTYDAAGKTIHVWLYDVDSDSCGILAWLAPGSLASSLQGIMGANGPGENLLPLFESGTSLLWFYNSEESFLLPKGHWLLDNGAPACLARKSLRRGVSLSLAVQDTKLLAALKNIVSFSTLEAGFQCSYAGGMRLFQAYLSGDIKFPATGNAQADAFFLSQLTFADGRAQGLAFEIMPHTPLSLTGGRQNLLGELIGDSAPPIALPDSLPDVGLTLDYLRGYVALDNPKLTNLGAKLSLSFDAWSPFEDGPLRDVLTLREAAVAVEWCSGAGVQWTIEGAISLASYSMVAAIYYPSMILTASVSPGNNSTETISGFLTNTLHVDQELANVVSDVLTAVDLQITADFAQKDLEVQVSNDRPWKVGGFLDVKTADLRLHFYENWQFTWADLYVALELPIGPMKNGVREDVEIDLEGEYDKVAKLFRFEGRTVPDEAISVGNAIAAMALKIGGSGVTVPAAIDSLAVQDLRIAFDSNGNAELSCVTELEIENTGLQFHVHFKRVVGGAAPEYLAAGTLFLSNGLSLGAAFSKGGDDSTVVGSLQYPLTLSSRELLESISPLLAADIPLEVEIELQGILLCWHKPAPPGGNQFLFRMIMNLDVDLRRLPLVGSMLPDDVGLEHFQILAGNSDLSAPDLAAYNNLLGEFDPPPPAIAGDPKAVEPTPSVPRGIVLSGSFHIGTDLRFPLFLQFGGGAQPSPAAGTTPASPTPNPGPASQPAIEKKAGPIQFHKVGLVYDKGYIGLKISAGLSIAILELDLVGLSVAVPMAVLHDPSRLEDIEFNLDGLTLDLEKGPLTLSLAFLRTTYKDQDGHSFDEYAGLVRLGFKDITLSGVGAFAMYDGHPSVYLFAALGIPLGGPPAFFVLGLMAGFGVNREFIPPPISQVADFPFVTLAVPFATAPSAKADLDHYMERLHASLPPRLGEYWLAAGIQFKSFGLVSTLGLVVVKFGRDLEIDILGVSSVLVPTGFLELQFLLRFVPSEGYLIAQGELTGRSFLYAPIVHLTGGFAAGFWFSGEHQGDFVISVGGYHPRFAVPAHYPSNIPRLGLNWQLSSVMSMKGGIYFAITPKANMPGGILEAVFDDGGLYASIRITADFIIYYAPFHYEAEIEVQAHVRVILDIGLFSLHFDMQISAGVELWGPEFSGLAHLQVGPKQFQIAFGADAGREAPPLTWDQFNTQFLPASGPGSIAITGGLQKQVKHTIGGQPVDVYVVNAKELAITTDSVMPLSAIAGVALAEQADPVLCNTAIGVAPMNRERLSAMSTISIEGPGSFKGIPVLKSIPQALWGQGFPKKDLASLRDGVLPNALSGVTIVPPHDPEGKVTHEMDRGTLAFETVQYPKMPAFLEYRMSSQNEPRPYQNPAGGAKRPSAALASAFRSFTGLEATDIDTADLVGADLRFRYLAPLYPVSFTYEKEV